MRNRRASRRNGDVDDRGWTALHISARNGDLRRVKELLDAGMDADVSASGFESEGLTPLHLAAKGGHVRVMKALLNHGASINAGVRRGFCRWTALHFAAAKRKNRAVSFLLKRGAVLIGGADAARCNPPLYYCPHLEWAYREQGRQQLHRSFGLM